MGTNIDCDIRLTIICFFDKPLPSAEKETPKTTEVYTKKTYKKVKKEKQVFPPAKTPAEATRNLMSARPRISKKINYDVIDTLVCVYFSYNFYP